VRMTSNDGNGNDNLGGNAMHELQKLFVDENFVEMERRLNQFNVFDVLKIREYEIRHTVFLSFLLDPHGSHGLGDRFLHDFLLRVGLSSAQPRFDLQDLDLQLAQVTSELCLKNGVAKAPGDRQLDIFLQIPQRSKPGHDLVIAIENKIKSKQSDNQLSDYRQWIEANRVGHDHVFVYLTALGEEPVDPAWIPVTYSNVVYPALMAAAGALEGRLAAAQLSIISDYIALLSSRVEEEAAAATLDDAAAGILKAHPQVQKTMAALCAKWRPDSRRDDRAITPDWALYCRHGKAFEFLSRYKTDPRSIGLTWIRNKWSGIAAAAGLQVDIDDSNRGYYRFLPTAKDSLLDRLVKQCGYQHRENERPKWTGTQRGMLFEIRSYNVDENDTKWVLFLVIGPLSQPNREHFITCLKSRMDQRRAEWTRVNGRPLETRGGMITDKFTSVLRYELKARNVDQFVREMSRPQFLEMLRDCADALIGALVDYVPPAAQ
jgi:hypothetical protein